MNFAQMLMSPTTPLFMPDPVRTARRDQADARYLDAIKRCGAHRVTAAMLSEHMKIHPNGICTYLRSMEERGIVKCVGKTGGANPANVWSVVIDD